MWLKIVTALVHAGNYFLNTISASPGFIAFLLFVTEIGIIAEQDIWENNWYINTEQE